MSIMEVTILEYKCFRGCNVRVQNYNYRKNRWVENPNFSFHLHIANQTGKYEFGGSPLIYKRIYKKEMKGYNEDVIQR